MIPLRLGAEPISGATRGTPATQKNFNWLLMMLLGRTRYHEKYY